MRSALRAPIRPLRVVDGGKTGSSATEPVEWIEVVVSWADTTLHVAHLRPGEGFVLSESVPAGTRGFAVPRGTVGSSCGELLVPHDGSIAVVVPDEPRALFVEGGRVRTRAEATRRGLLVRSEAYGAWVFPLRAHRRCRLSSGNLRVEVGAVEPAEPVGKPIVALKKSHWAILAVSAMLHLLIAAAILGLPKITP